MYNIKSVKNTKHSTDRNTIILVHKAPPPDIIDAREPYTDTEFCNNHNNTKVRTMTIRTRKQL